MPAGREQRGRKPRQGELSKSCGVQGKAHPRLTDQEGVKQEKVRKKELRAEKNGAKEIEKKDKKQEKEDNNKRVREGGSQSAGFLCVTYC
jgi:hypothetical protein